MSDPDGFGLAAGTGGDDEAYAAQQAREAASDKNYNKVVRSQPIGTMTQSMRNDATGEVTPGTTKVMMGRRIPKSRF